MQIEPITNSSHVNPEFLSPNKDKQKEADKLRELLSRSRSARGAESVELGKMNSGR